MKKLNLIRNLVPWVIALWGYVTIAWADHDIHGGNGDLFVMIYLAFCALIILVQLIPAILILFGFLQAGKKEMPQADAKKLHNNEVTS